MSNDVHLESEVPGLVIKGENNTVRVGANARIDARVIIEGDGHTIDVGHYTTIKGVLRCVGGNGSTIRIGHDTTIAKDSAIHAMEGRSVLIGVDCQFSMYVQISTSDMHPIYDTATGERINAAADVHIGEHVWLGLSAMINKGARIGSGSIVGNGAVVTGELPSNVIAAGVPARVIRQGARWARDF